MIFIYWSLILLALWQDVILTPDSPLYAYKWEKVAFRAAWVSITQLPMVYCLSCKHNIISWITGISYERLNWMHRWSAITLFFTIIVHWSYFFREWTLGDIVSMEISMMPMVRYGFAAWAVLGWLVITSFGFFRQLAYEFFVVQHIFAAFILLWLVHVHVPSYARYNIWMAVSFVVLDRGLRLILFMWRNNRRWRSGYDTSLEILPGRAVEMIIRNVAFQWKAGQHVYIWVPSVGFFENHPFTIANSVNSAQTRGLNDMKLVIKACAGFSNRLYEKCASSERISDACKARVFLSGPWGKPPDLTPFDSVVLIASGSGAAFTTPLLESLASYPGFVRRIDFHWITPCVAELKWFEDQLISVLEMSENGHLYIQINLFVSRSSNQFDMSTSPNDTNEKHDTLDAAKPSSSSATQSSHNSLTESSSITHETALPQTPPTLPLTSHANASIIFRKHPSPDSLIRPALELAKGETAVVICGNSSLVADVRTYVSRISDERAVHKGTGAQGIFLFTEKFDW